MLQTVCSWKLSLFKKSLFALVLFVCRCPLASSVGSSLHDIRPVALQPKGGPGCPGSVARGNPGGSAPCCHQLHHADWLCVPLHQIMKQTGRTPLLDIINANILCLMPWYFLKALASHLFKSNHVFFILTIGYIYKSCLKKITLWRIWVYCTYL